MPLSESQRARRKSPEGRELRREQDRRRRDRQVRNCPDCGTPLDFHKKLCAGCRDARLAARRRQGRPRVPKTRPEYTYGLSLEELSQMLEAQGGVCAVCGDELPGPDVPAHHKMQVDHDHRCCPGIIVRCGGKCVRGLVHGHCNRGVGQLGDDPEVYLRAAAYIAASNERLGFGPDRRVPGAAPIRRRVPVPASLFGD